MNAVVKQILETTPPCAKTEVYFGPEGKRCTHSMVFNWNWQCWWIMFRQFQLEVVEHVRDYSWCGHVFLVLLVLFVWVVSMFVLLVLLLLLLVDHYKPPSSWTLEGRVNLSLLLLSSFLALFGMCALLSPGYSPDGNEDDDPPSDEPCLAKHPEVPKGLARSHLAHCFSNFKQL